ncbi:MAG TPA: LON peptidase substrate-binding domain-containing protein [Acidimicrobiales bacterium]|nr:LON peptidase substrate-binding domain-containing protein [Acidimicrobiales bacterium]
MSRYLPVFPLGSPLLPTQILPLHIFEDRYRLLMESLTSIGSTAEMGVVLIERGSEVGGGDARMGTGTVAHLIESERLPDGRWMAIFAGSHRFRVDRWLPDDPYPQAMVAEQADEDWDEADLDRLAAAEAGVRRALGLARELGDPGANPGFTLNPEPVIAAWELCVRAPLGALDHQRLLDAPDRPSRLDLLVREVAEVSQLLAFRLRGG